MYVKQKKRFHKVEAYFLLKIKPQYYLHGNAYSYGSLCVLDSPTRSGGSRSSTPQNLPHIANSNVTGQTNKSYSENWDTQHVNGFDSGIHETYFSRIIIFIQ